MICHVSYGRWLEVCEAMCPKAGGWRYARPCVLRQVVGGMRGHVS